MPADPPSKSPPIPNDPAVAPETAASPSPRNDLTRRRFIAGGAAVAAVGGLGEALPTAFGEQTSRRRPVGRPPRRVDVAIIGAGMAGLVAATRLVAAGRSVVVLEARERVGGRIKGWRCGMPPPCDCGQLIGPDHVRVRALAKHAGIDLYRQHAAVTGQGSEVVYVGGTRGEVPAGGPLNSRALSPLVADASIPFRELDSMAATVPPEAPWNAQRAAEWDSMTVETWKQQNTFSEFGRFWIDLLVLVAGSTDAGEMSLLHLLAYLSRLANRGTSSVLDFLFLSSLAEGGLQQLPNHLAQALGRRVVLGAPVRRIVQRGGRVEIQADRLSVTAKRAIVATAPALNSMIEFEPAVPALRGQLAQRFPQGSGAVDVCLIYQRPFWRDQGLTGRAAGLEPFFTVLDYSPPDSPTGRLVASTIGFQQRRYMTLGARQRRQLLFDNLATYFGEQARHPLAMIERNWTGPVPLDAPWVDDLQAQWTRGCPGYLPPGVLRSFGPAINAPFGAVHWTSTEHSVSFNTYVEGAVRSAEAVADDVLARL